VSYAEIIKKARSRIKLSDLGFEEGATRIRRAMNGGLVIEMLGAHGSTNADLLAEKLKEVISEDAFVNRPVAKGELRIIGLDDSVSPDELIDEIIRSGNCDRGHVKIGDIRPMANGLGTVWAQCPIAAAHRLARQGYIAVGWTRARVRLLDMRPLQCYRCWAFGHIRGRCTVQVDRRGCCFRCGSSGHAARTCNLEPFCVVCHDSGGPTNHRLGTVNCAAYNAAVKTMSGNARPGTNLETAPRNVQQVVIRTGETGNNVN